MWLRWLERRRLATRLTLAVILLAVPLEALAFATAGASLQERREAELDSSVLVAQALAAVIDGFAGDLQSSLLAASLALGARPEPLDQQTAGPYLAAVAREYPALRAFFLTDLDGRLTATGTGGELGFDLSGRPYLVRLRAGAETVWTGALVGIQTRETTVAYGRVVRAPDGTPRAYLVAAFYPDQLIDRMPVQLPPDARVTVVDANGGPIYDSTPDNQPFDPDESADLRRALAGEPIRIAGQSPLAPGEARFGALVPIQRLGWAVAFTRPLAAVETALATQALAQAGGIAAIVLLAAGLMIVTARRLTAPLTSLAGAADAIARGERPDVPAVQADADLARLARAMQLMSAAVAEREGDLVEQREWLRVTLASIGDGVLATDPAGRVTFMNEPAVELSGWPAEDALGRPIGEVLTLRNEATGELVENPIQRVLAEGMVVGLANHTILVRRDGTERPIDDSAAPIRDERGELRGVVMVFRDVTERRRSEQALRESAERLRLAVEAAPVVLFNHDRELRYTWIGKPLAGRSADEIVGKTDADLFPSEYAEPLRALKRQTLELGATVAGEVELPAGPSESEAPSRTWRLTVEPLRDRDGEIVGITCAAVDVTEQRTLERLQQEFISMVSHELRNPLASIKGYAQLMQRRGTYHARAVQSIVQQGDQLDRLITDLLDSSRLQAGRLELRRRTVTLAGVAAVAVERAQAQTARHTIRLDGGDEAFAGFWDPERLAQVFANLLSNAVKYSPDGGEIVVRLQPVPTFETTQTSEVAIAVQDDGLGIDPDHLPRLFGRFYRATSTSGWTQGLGVGLYVAKELVEAHGGRIWAESAGRGHGSTFWFTLPLASRPSRTGTGGAPVLVVDDDDALRELVAETLRGEGYRVTTARDGLDAIQQVERELPALVLLDWMMPRMNGEGFATALRERPEYPRIPVIVMTAGGEAAARAAQIGADGFIHKPFDLGLLLNQVARYLTLSQADARPG